MNGEESIVTVYISQPNGPATVVGQPQQTFQIVIAKGSEAQVVGTPDVLPPLKFVLEDA